jgi:hypothetical protein
VSEELPDPKEAVVAAVDVAAWSIEAAKQVALNHEDYQRAAALADVRRSLDRILGSPESRGQREVEPLGDLLRVIPVNRTQGHVTVISVELYEHETNVRYVDDRGFDRLRDRELGLADDLGAVYKPYGHSVIGRGKDLARGDASFRPGLSSAAATIRLLTEGGEISVSL